jgi:hypothetical protein
LDTYNTPLRHCLLGTSGKLFQKDPNKQAIVTGKREKAEKWSEIRKGKSF